MLKITMLGIALAAIALSGIASAAGAETIPSPLAQVRDGVQADDIICSDGHVLMTSPSRNPACVFAGSAEALERRGFVLPPGTSGDDLSVSRSGTLYETSETGILDGFETGGRPFVTTWRVSGSDRSITIPVGNATGTYTVDWGDGSISANVTGDQKHTYYYGETYTVRITGSFERIYLNNHTTNAPKLQSIEQWGDVSWMSMGSAFYGASSMIYNAGDVPDLSGVTDMSDMFHDASKFNGDVSKWDVSHVTDMSDMFHGALSFSRSLSEWDVSNVTDMSGMFTGGLVNVASSGGGVSSAPSLLFYPYYASRFNGDISTWDVSKVTDMSDMFHHAHHFKGDLSSWDVSSVTDMSGMFASASSFRGDLSSWDVSHVTDMSGMFQDASRFKGGLSGWNVSGVTDMSDMFRGLPNFKGGLSGWNVSGVTDMSYMFARTYSFNSDLSEWNVSGVTDMSKMFSNTNSFNGNLSSWDVSGVTDMSGMFQDASRFNGNLSSWDVSGVTDMSGMFQGTSRFNGDISPWDVSGVTDMSGMFQDASRFNGDISSWNVSNVKNMKWMFYANPFNGDISPWDVSGVTDMTRMFDGATSFNQNLGNWYVVLDSTSIDIGGGAMKIGNIATQNPILDGQNPTYGMGSGADSDLFEIDGDVLVTKPSVDYSGKAEYAVNITSTGDFGKNNFRVINVTVTGASNTELP